MGNNHQSERMAEQAEQYKTEGTKLYKERKFPEAIELYQKAWDTFPENIVYLNNLAAAQYENGDLDAALETSEKAVEAGRDMRADYKLIAKAFGRMGTIYLKKAIKHFHKSLTEHCTPDILAKLKDAEKAQAERERQAYINPELGDKAREEGNVAFKAGDFAAAVKHYDEAIKRSPKDARGYTNKSAALTKLLALPEALKEAERAIEADPSYVKAYIRKSHVLFAMKECTKATQAIEEAARKDEDKKHTREIQQQMVKVMQADAESRQGETEEQTLERAMRDPEVATIMRDPAFQSILQQAQENPASLQQHMQNAEVRRKVEKLVRAGIIKTR